MEHGDCADKGLAGFLSEVAREYKKRRAFPDTESLATLPS
jgi:hypothetical protein